MSGTGYLESIPAPTQPTGGSGNQIFYQNDQTVTANYSIPSGQNAMTGGPVSINTGITVTVPSGSTWTIT
jgi:hypothetical protein